jgi:hypothetical protein
MVKSYQDIVDFDAKNNLLDYCINTETFDHDMRVVLKRLGVNDDEIERVFEKVQGKTNATVRKKYTDYYDDESIKLVREWERFLIDKYKFSYE